MSSVVVYLVGCSGLLGQTDRKAQLIKLLKCIIVNSGVVSNVLYLVFFCFEFCGN